MRYAFLAVAMLVANFAFAVEGDFTAAKQLIGSNVTCGNLSADQLELIGDYYMERMHPGQAHEAMDRMMGGEGSGNLRRVHTEMALVLYCNETGTPATYGGMMAMMPMMYRFTSGGMGDYGLMGWNGMMGYGSWGGIVYALFWLLLFAALVVVIIWLYRNATGGMLSSTEILKQRYARGELSKKQYEEMKKTLEEH